MSKKYRLGLLGFLNALPLVHKLRGHEEVEEVWGNPAELTNLLRRREVDAAVTSSYAYAAKYRKLLCDLCIAAEKRAETVVLYSTVPLEKIKTVEEDPASLTSNALTRIIFADRGQHISFKPIDNYRAPLSSGSARLLIGDMNFNPPFRYDFAFDIASLIWDMYRLPCVFALWQGVEGIDGRIKELVEWAFKETEKDWSSLYEYASKHWNLPPMAIRDYFQNVLHYRLTDKDMEFLEFFAKKVHDLGLKW